MVTRDKVTFHRHQPSKDELQRQSNPTSGLGASPAPARVRTQSEPPSSPYLIKLLLLLFQVGHQLPLVVQIDDQVVQLLLKPVLGLIQFVISSCLLFELLGEAFDFLLELLLALFQGFHGAGKVLQLLLRIGELKWQCPGSNKGRGPLGDSRP